MRTELLYGLTSDYVEAATKEKVKVFLVDDDPIFVSLLKEYLQKKEIALFVFSSGEECLKNLYQNPDIIVLDYYLDGDSPHAMNGLEVLKRIKRKFPDTEVIILSGQEQIDVAIESLKEGAYDYFTKSEDALEKTREAIKSLSEQVMLKRLGEREARTFNRMNIVLFLLLIVFMLTRIFQ